MTLLIDAPRDKARAAMRRRPVSSHHPGSRDLEQASAVSDAFYAGRYDDVLRRTVDRGAEMRFTDDEAPYVIGALAFVGRLEEGRALLAAWERQPREVAARVASRFFLGVGLCRAGAMEEAARLFVQNARLGGRRAVAQARFYVAQGLGIVRYFAGRMRPAARHSARALSAAYEARFQYGRLLATDLRGHALVELGSVRAGLGVLEQAQRLAADLGLNGNAGAIGCAIAIYAARYGVTPLGASADALERLARAPGARDGYSVRDVEMDLALLYAVGGRADEAWSLLSKIAAATPPDGDRRAGIRVLVALGFVARLRYGASGAAQYIADARRLLDGSSDLALEVEVTAAEIVLGVAGGRVTERRARLEALWQITGMARARIALEGAGAGGLAPAMELFVCALAEASASDRLTTVERLAREGAFGLVPVALGLPPSRRLLVLSETVLVEEYGAVRSVQLGDGGLRLLRVLADGAWHDKAALLRAAWGLAYHPERHDPVIHTAISRLRAALGSARHFVEAHDGAYRLADGIAFVGDLPRVPAEASSGAPAAPRDDVAGNEDAIVARLRGGALSTAEIARALGVSEMTAFRRVRALVEGGVLARTGRGKRTRYALMTALEGAPCKS